MKTEVQTTPSCPSCSPVEQVIRCVGFGEAGTFSASTSSSPFTSTGVGPGLLKGRLEPLLPHSHFRRIKGKGQRHDLSDALVVGLTACNFVLHS